MNLVSYMYVHLSCFGRYLSYILMTDQVQCKWDTRDLQYNTRQRHMAHLV